MGMMHARVDTRRKCGEKSIMSVWWRQCWVGSCGLDSGMWCWHVIGQEWNVMCGGRAIETVAGINMVCCSWCFMNLQDQGVTGGVTICS